ncbi:DUF2630 family protein [Euzebya tangerina]|uniref:DUF2630 family protein n=1 Tax=Euzebya tangerina TaxID=591198 RepID=UPI000E30C363|nr:DUF2630 family protein [Euzebya tangerina]
MDDAAILRRIHQLVDEEDELRAQPDHALDEDERARMTELEEGLDQCWDLLRQRRAKREFGEDPDSAQARSTTVVEGYSPTNRRG